MSKIQVFNKGLRSITSSEGVIKSNCSKGLSKAEADKLMKMYSGELMLLQATKVKELDKEEAKIKELEKQVLELQKDVATERTAKETAEAALEFEKETHENLKTAHSVVVQEKEKAVKDIETAHKANKK